MQVENKMIETSGGYNQPFGHECAYACGRLYNHLPEEIELFCIVCGKKQVYVRKE